MSDAPSSGKPAVLRQEGPHRVTVAPGAHSALSSSPGPSGPRLRPAVGAASPQAPEGGAAPMRQAASLRQRSGAGAAAVTEVRHIAGRTPGTAGPHSETDAERAAASAALSALEQRLSALAELNFKTSKTVTSFEGDVGFHAQPTPAPGGLEPPVPQKASRSLFKWRSS